MTQHTRLPRYAVLLQTERRLVLQIIFKEEVDFVGVLEDFPRDIEEIPNFVMKISQHFSFLVLPLTLRNDGSLRIAELIHWKKLPLKTILVSASNTTNEGNATPLFDFYISWNTIGFNSKILWPKSDSKTPNRLNKAIVKQQVRRFLSREGCFYWQNGRHPPEKPTYDEYRKGIRDDTTRPYLSVWYLSYAWGDRTPEGIERDRAVNLFCKKASENNYLIARDKDVLKTGDSLFDFMQQVGRGERIFIILSDKYLKSENCMFELSEIWRVSQQDGQIFRRKIRVYTLPDAKIWSQVDRLQYAIFWKEKFDLIKDIHSSHGLTIGGKAGFQNMLLLQKIHQEIADILQNIVDTLQPRSINELADVNFRYEV